LCAAWSLLVQSLIAGYSSSSNIFIDRYNAWSDLLDCRKQDNETYTAWLGRSNFYRELLMEILRRDAPSDAALASSDTPASNDANRRGVIWYLDQFTIVSFIRKLPPKCEALKQHLLQREDLNLAQLRVSVQTADQLEVMEKRVAKEKAEADAKAKIAATSEWWCHVHDVTSHANATSDCKAVKKHLAAKDKRKGNKQKAGKNRQ
jgi:hypothetical protein